MLPVDRSQWSLAPLLAALALGLSGCADTLRRDDFITAHTGDAHAANKAIQIVDPWRRESFETRLPVDGGRMAAPVGRYRAGEAAAAPAAASRGPSTQ